MLPDDGRRLWLCSELEDTTAKMKQMEVERDHWQARCEVALAQVQQEKEVPIVVRAVVDLSHVRCDCTGHERLSADLLPA